MSELENDSLKTQILGQLERAMFHSMTTSELSRQLESMPRKVRRACMELQEEGKVSALLTNDYGRPEYRYFLMAQPVVEKGGFVEVTPEEHTPWYRRVLGWFK